MGAFNVDVGGGEASSPGCDCGGGGGETVRSTFS